MRRFIPSLCGTFFVVLLLASLACATRAADGKIPITTKSEEAKKEFLKGRELSEKLELTNSIEHFDKAIALDPEFALAYLNRANVATTAKEFFDHLQNAVKNADKVSEGERLLILAADANSSGNAIKQKQYFEKVAAKYPKDERALFAAGGFYFGQQEYDKAIEQYEKATALAPDYSPAYNILGYAYRQVEKYADAEKAFKKYTELIPNDPNPYDSYAELLMKMGKYDESIALYQKALDVDKTFVSSRIGIATNSMYKGMHDAGAAELKKLWEMARNDGERRQAMFTQMVLYVDAGNMEDALKEVEKQYAMGENDNDLAQMSGDLVLKGNILREMGKYDDAGMAYEQSIKLSDKSNVSKDVKENAWLFHHFNLVTVAVGKNDLKTARAEAEKFRQGAEASKNANQIRQSHELMGMIALAQKNYDGAISELQKSNHQNPYNMYRLAWAYQEKGDKTKAKEYSAKAAHFNGLPGLNSAFIRTKAMKMMAM